MKSMSISPRALHSLNVRTHSNRNLPGEGKHCCVLLLALAAVTALPCTLHSNHNQAQQATGRREPNRAQTLPTPPSKQPRFQLTAVPPFLRNGRDYTSYKDDGFKSHALTVPPSPPVALQPAEPPSPPPRHALALAAAAPPPRPACPSPTQPTCCPRAKLALQADLPLSPLA